MVGVARGVLLAFALVGVGSLFPAAQGCTDSADRCTDMHIAPNYDQSCSVDSDCVAYIAPTDCCASAAISAAAQAQYLSDRAGCGPSPCTVLCTDESLCCVNGACQLDNCPVPTPSCTADIQAANYDQSCSVDSDCVAVGEGSACSPCALACPNAAINVAGHAQYLLDVAMTPAGASGCTVSCAVAELGPCCRNGACHSDTQCSGVDAAADTGASDAGTEGGPDAADACAPSGCTGSCLAGRHNVSTMVNGCLVWQCCAPDDAGADASGE